MTRLDTLSPLSRRTLRRSLSHDLRLGLLLAVTLAVLAPSLASAYNLNTSWACPNGKKWKKDPTFGFSAVSFPTAYHRNAVRQPARRINEVGAQSVDLVGWSSTYNTVSSGNLRNEVWIGPTWGGGKESIMMTVRWGFGCRVTETDIVFNNDEDFRFDQPSAYGLDYWRLGFRINDPGNPAHWDILVRPPLLHEALHAVGLDHVDNTWAYQNYGKLPWVNGEDGTKTVEPLPDDRRGLRALYGTSGSESDVAVSTLWNRDDTENGAAVQQVLCKPTTGSGWSPQGMFSTYCADDASTTVCPGDTVYTRFTMANFGTSPELLTYELFFSKDDNLSPGTDIASDTDGSREVNRHYSIRKTFTVPDEIGPGTYWPIVRLEGGFEEGYRNNWIPLPGQVTVPIWCTGPGDKDSP